MSINKFQQRKKCKICGIDTKRKANFCCNSHNTKYFKMKKEIPKGNLEDEYIKLQVKYEVLEASLKKHNIGFNRIKKALEYVEQ